MIWDNVIAPDSWARSRSTPPAEMEDRFGAHNVLYKCAQTVIKILLSGPRSKQYVCQVVALGFCRVSTLGTLQVAQKTNHTISCDAALLRGPRTELEQNSQSLVEVARYTRIS